MLDFSRIPARVAIVTLAAAAGLFTTAGFWATQNDWSDCGSNDPDRRIAGCTRVLDGRNETQYIRAASYINRGGAWVAKGDLDRAIADYTEAIHLDSKFTAAYTSRGSAWQAKHDLGRAIADYTEAIQLGPEYPGNYIDRGNAWRDKGDFDRAIADYTEAIHLDPGIYDDDRSDTYISRGNAWRDKGDLDRAIADYTEAIRLDPKNEVAVKAVERARTALSAR
jgi:tetratricopeptide (TPR) repeat protein